MSSNGIHHLRNVDIGGGATRIVVVEPPVLDLHVDLGEKLYEIRCKRDAISLHHESLKKQNDSFNKTIIILSLATAFTETLKSTLQLTDETVYGKTISNLAKIAPIGISTLTAIVSSLMKFRKYPERMETLTKASEKFNHTATRMRRLQEELSFVDEAAAKKMYIDEVMEFYRESLQEAEATIYPDVRQKYFKRAQDNIVKMQKNERTFMKTCRKLNAEMERMRMEPYDLKANRPIPVDTVDTPAGVLDLEDDASEKDVETPTGASETKDETPKAASKSWIKPSA
uniref:Uncharacterized protein n=1 Tax=viral metagenome TaxID=1070528 RepID=A0A6C0K8K1_9ZZZZ